MKKSEIHIAVALDNDHVPEAISWRATDAGDQLFFAKAINLALWDRNEAGTMKIDLWTKDMPVNEMKYFCLDTIGSMAESLKTATNDDVMVKKMRDLCEELAQYLNEKGE